MRAQQFLSYQFTIVGLGATLHALRKQLRAIALRLGRSSEERRRMRWQNEAGAAIAVLPA